MKNYILTLFLLISGLVHSATLTIGNNASHTTTGNATYDALTMGNSATLTVVSGHILTITGNATSSNGLGITVQNGATLNINGCLTGNNNFNLNVAGTINIGCIDVDNNGQLTIQGTGIVNVSGNLTTGQNTTVNVQLNGDLIVGGNVVIGSGSSQVIVNGTFDISGQYTGPTPTGSGSMNDTDQQFLPANLPVILKEISIDCENSNLYWITATEWNTSHFLIYQSLDGQIWTEISNVKAAGASQNEISYEVPLKPNKGKYYVKVEQWDLDNKYVDLGILSCYQEGQINTYPNPSPRDFFINLNSDIKSGSYLLEIRDMSNRVMYQNSVVKNLDNTVIPMSWESKGCFLIQILNEGQIISSIKHCVN